MIPRKLSLDMEQIEPQSLRRPMSLYDSILDSFIFSESNTMAVLMKGKDPSYVRSQLVRRIKARYTSGTSSRPRSSTEISTCLNSGQRSQGGEAHELFPQEGLLHEQPLNEGV